MHKYRLFAPGPTPVPESVLAALARPILHHRTSDFEAIFAQVQQGLRWIFQCNQEVLCLAGTGTAAMDGAVCNLLSPGDTAIFVNAGKFGERWGDILRAYGIQAVEITVPWGQAVSPAAVQKALAAHPQARAVYMQACETSTGVMHPVAPVAALCKDLPNTLCVVDGITAVGVARRRPSTATISMSSSAVRRKLSCFRRGWHSLHSAIKRGRRKLVASCPSSISTSPSNAQPPAKTKVPGPAPFH